MTGIAVHLPALQVLLPMLVSPLVMLLRPRGLAWAVVSGHEEHFHLAGHGVAVARAENMLDGVGQSRLPLPPPPPPRSSRQTCATLRP